jgi:GNAT superfamily N-acetyltransferase
MMHCVISRSICEMVKMDQILETFRASDGTELRIRALEKNDAGYLVDLFEHMGAESRFLRFNLSLPNPDPELVWEEARRLADVDPGRDGAWLVLADLPGQPDAPVAGVRYIRIDETSAEASLAVRDDMQNKGIGRELLRFLIVQARSAGIERLVGTVQRSNLPLWRLLKKFPLTLTLDSEGSYTTITADLSRPEVIQS